MSFVTNQTDIVTCPQPLRIDHFWGVLDKHERLCYNVDSTP
jgi:hypothetical protein